MANDMPARRKAFVLSLPWVTWVEKAKPCAGIRWGEVPLKAVFGTSQAGPINLEKYRCKAPAHYRFVALRVRGAWDRPATTGMYCQNHLWQQMEHKNERECARLDEQRKAYRS